MSTLQAHPAAELFPLLSGDEYESFKADIEKNGLIEPIWLCEGKILDGRNRYRACTELGIEPKFQPYRGESPLAFVWSLNVERRHLSKSQHAAIGVEMLPLFQEEAEKRRNQAEGRPQGEKSVTRKVEEQSGEAASQVAGIVGVDRSYIYDAKLVKEKDPALFAEVKAGAVSVHKAKKLVNGATPPHEPDDKKRKPLEVRLEEIRSLASEGYRASQIAEEIGLCEDRVRTLANQNDITLPDKTIRSHKINPRRIIETTVFGLEGNKIVFDTIRGGDWDITADEAKEWHASLGKSIKELNWLRNKLGVIANGN